MILGWEVLNSYLLDIFVDIMGYVFILLMFCYLGGCQVGCYVYYFIISIDMLLCVGD